VGKQELEIKLGGDHICFNTTKLGSVLQVQQSKDPDGLRIFYYLVQVWGGWVGLGWEVLCFFRLFFSTRFDCVLRRAGWGGVGGVGSALFFEAVFQYPF
jgi:hypothetical protein